MDGPDGRDVRRAFVMALNESGERYMLIGEMAWHKHYGPTDPKTAEAWMDPSANEFEVIDVHARTVRKLEAQFPGTDMFELLDRVRTETKIYQEVDAPLSFETSYASRAPATFCDQHTSVVSADHLAAFKLKESLDSRNRHDFDERAEEARQLLSFARSEERADQTRQMRNPGPEDDPKPRPPLRVVKPET